MYGTLKKGSWNHYLLETATFLSKATVRGTLYDLGGIPGYVRGDEGVVHGELYRVDDDTLANLDVLEGYNRANPGLSMYQRVEVEGCYVYEINMDISLCEPIKTGEW